MLSRKTNLSSIFFYLLILFLPAQFGKHFWPDFSYVYGIRIDYLSPTLYLTDILIILILFSWVIESLVKIKIVLSQTKKARSSIIKLTLLLFAVLFLPAGIFFSKSPQAGWYGMIKFIEYIFLFSYTVKNFRKLNNFVLFSGFVAGVFFESFLTIAQYINQGSLGGIFYFLGERSFNSQTPGIANASINGQIFLRPYATFSHPNVLAGYLFISMILIIFFAKHKFFKQQNLLVFLSLFFGSLALFLTMGRISIIAWTISLFFLIACNLLKKTGMDFTKKAYLKAVKNKILVLVFLITVIFIFTFPVGLRFFQFSFSDESVIQREILIKDSMVMFQKSPIFGVGLNNFLINLPFIQKQHKDVLYIQPVHNIYLLVLSQTGTIGFILFMYFLAKTYKKIRKGNFELLILFFGVLFLGFFDHYFLTLQQGQILFTVLLALFWSYSKRQSNKRMVKYKEYLY